MGRPGQVRHYRLAPDLNLDVLTVPDSSPHIHKHTEKENRNEPEDNGPRISTAISGTANEGSDYSWEVWPPGDAPDELEEFVI
jgi:hypothetical protein